MLCPSERETGGVSGDGIEQDSTVKVICILLFLR